MYSNGFIEYWLQRILYWEFPPSVFIVIYSVFTLLVMAAWILVPPKRHDNSGGVCL